ncbi:uncharacterized protein MEPE_04681 [Melanopsichium pennsylvanicum]|uniref:Uncharacterized protein n=2 Tax=Melanopsichium pennsylvanicum TaxID=63383 RepID=A0AAJ4XPG0_9BASI|nr:putative protein [Melanopsichium pennsylvanicum 4]SNX85972.1 uncharacterized protein MEPE_04681 [Melanopsichium pennsylvanicum]
MLSSQQTARLGLLILASAALGASAFPIRTDGPSVFAPDAARSLQKRAIMKGDHYVPLGNTNVPLSPLLLVFGGLGAAAVGLVVAMLRIMVPSCMSRSSRIVLQERERARQDLRVRGAVSPRASPDGSPAGGSTPTHTHARRFPPNKPPRKLGRNSRASLTPLESASISSTSKRPSHGYRGTSFSLSDARKHTDRSSRSSVSALQLPLLNSNDSSSGSSSFHINGKDSAMSERAKYLITATNVPLSPQWGNTKVSFGTRDLNRTSSIGKGADLQRTRSGKRENNHEITLHPQPVDPAYAQRRVRKESYTHPLQQQQASNRTDSTLSMYEVSSSSEQHSHSDSNATSRIGSFSNMSGNPLQPMSMPGFGGQHVGQTWSSSPKLTSRSSSPELVSSDPSRLGVAHNAVATSRNSSVSGLLDSDGSDHGTTPQTAVLIPSRATSITR